MPTKKPLKASELSDLYPKAKTYDERLAERSKIDALKERRKPKFILLQTSGLLTVTCALVIVILWSAPLVLGFNLMAGTFFAFGVLMLLVVYGKYLIGRITFLYEQRGKNARTFLLLYILFVAALLAVVQLAGWDQLIQSPGYVGILLTLHFMGSLSLAWATRNIGSSRV